MAARHGLARAGCTAARAWAAAEVARTGAMVVSCTAALPPAPTPAPAQELHRPQVSWDGKIGRPTGPRGRLRISSPLSPEPTFQTRPARLPLARARSPRLREREAFLVTDTAHLPVHDLKFMTTACTSAAPAARRRAQTRAGCWCGTAHTRPPRPARRQTRPPPGTRTRRTRRQCTPGCW